MEGGEDLFLDLGHFFVSEGAVGSLEEDVEGEGFERETVFVLAEGFVFKNIKKGDVLDEFGGGFLDEGLNFGDGFFVGEGDGNIESEAGEFGERLVFRFDLAEFDELGEVDFENANGVLDVEIVGDGWVEFVDGAEGIDSRFGSRSALPVGNDKGDGFGGMHVFGGRCERGEL